ncbi:MAG: VWA domain-containing protein [Deltaproteobacteria bacterium]|nr:VWA domain-containing protein [Deltaproteobacteria bacterium]
MKHPAPLFAFAVATLAGAFLLSSSTTPPPKRPVVKKTPVKKSTQPVGALTFADHTLQVTAQLDRTHLQQIPGGVASESVWMNVELQGADTGARADLAAVLVIDRSGSMAGEKIDNARRAARRMLNQLKDGDQLAIVSYGSDISVDLPLTFLNAQSRARAKRVIGSLEEGGGTHIDGGMKAATRLIQKAQLTGKVGRVILISDGRPTEGERRSDVLVRHSNALREMGVTLSTIGVGLDYNEDLMQALATSGGGRYHYLKRSRQLSAIVDAELSHASRIVARSVQLHLSQSLPGFEVVAVNGISTSDKGMIMVKVGDLAAGEKRSVLLRLDVKPIALSAASARTFAAPEVLYTKAIDGQPTLLAQRADHFHMALSNDAHVVDQSRDAHVRVQVLKMATAMELQTSMKAYSRGDLKGATDGLQKRMSALSSVAKETGDNDLKREAENVSRVLKKLRKAAPKSDLGMDLVKEQKAHAFDLLY